MSCTSSDRPPLLIGSFAYRYAIGTDTFHPSRPLSVLDFLHNAQELGYNGVQLCENLRFSDLDPVALAAVRDTADTLGLTIEVGMRGLTEDNLHKHFRIMEILSSKFLRVVIGEKSPGPDTHPQKSVEQSIRILKKAMKYCGDAGIRIGLENHFDLPIDRLTKIVDEVDNPNLGMVFDTTNGLGFIQAPEQVLAAIGHRLLSAHIKDYRSEKEDTGYRMTGTVLGEGWLKTQAIVRAVMSVNPAASMVLEMSIPRDETQTEQETLTQEKEAIATSTRYLRDIVDHQIKA